MTRFLRIIGAIVACLTVAATFAACGNTEDTIPADTTATTTVATTATTAQGDPQPEAASTMIASFADEDIIEKLELSPAYAVGSEFDMPVLLEAVGTVTDVEILTLILTPDGDGYYTVTEVAASLGTLDSAEHTLVMLDFPGDFSAWGLRFTDSTGAEKSYVLYMSGEDGSLVTSEDLL
ncbi:MAG: hypothetical protein IKV35_00455 [Clostridia bacterium]|nr:hypothetical protein [Clostridia bacterium]